MILTHDAILAEIDAGRIQIDPFERSQVGPASIDLHLGDELRLLEGGPRVIDIHEDTDFLDVSRTEPLGDSYELAPGETIHGITRERITLPGDIAGWLEGRSRFARLGLMIHVTAGFVNPGVTNRQVLEISNLAGRPLRLHPGTRLCQIVLQRCEGSAIYAGRFARQQSP
jgi:dCTP deaminase